MARCKAASMIAQDARPCPAQLDLKRGAIARLRVVLNPLATSADRDALTLKQD